MTRLVHITTFARSGGGMQALVRRRRAGDAAHGLAAETAAIFEPAGAAVDAGLAARWWWTPGGVRAGFQRELAARTRGALVIYHNGWALPLLAPGDGARRRAAWLHTDWPGFNAAVAAMTPWCDAFFCASDELAEQVRRAAPDFAGARIHVVPYCIEPPTPLSLPGRIAGFPFQVGFVGRLEVAQKRVDRLPELAARLPGGGNISWQVIGDGPARRRLERGLGGDRAKFHGWLSGPGYWAALAGLDAIVFTSDYEGLPIALLEALHAGVVPLYPAIGGAGERLARQVDPACVYPAGDMPAAARLLAALAGRNDREKMRALARSLAADFTPAKHEAAYGRAVQAWEQMPGIANDRTDRTGRWSDHVPLALVRRIFPDALWR